MSVLAGLEVGSVDPDVGVGTFQWPASETLELLIELLAQLGDVRLLEMPPIPKAFTSSSTPPCG